MKRTKRNPKPIFTGRKPLWNSGNALFQNGATGASLRVETSVERYDIFAPVSESEDLFQAFEPQQAAPEIGPDDFAQVLLALLKPEVVSR